MQLLRQINILCFFNQNSFCILLLFTCVAMLWATNWLTMPWTPQTCFPRCATVCNGCLVKVVGREGGVRLKSKQPSRAHIKARRYIFRFLPFLFMIIFYVSQRFSDAKVLMALTHELTRILFLDSVPSFVVFCSFAHPVPCLIPSLSFPSLASSPSSSSHAFVLVRGPVAVPFRSLFRKRNMWDARVSWRITNRFKHP